MTHAARDTEDKVEIMVHLDSGRLQRPMYERDALSVAVCGIFLTMLHSRTLSVTETSCYDCIDRYRRRHHPLQDHIQGVDDDSRTR